MYADKSTLDGLLKDLEARGLLENGAEGDGRLFVSIKDSKVS